MILNAGGETLRRIRGIPRGLAGLALGAALILLGTGCRLVKSETIQTKSMFESLVGKNGDPGATNTLDILQSEVMRNADMYVGAIATASDAFIKRVGTPEARLAGLQWKLLEATSAYIDATGENPLLDAVDFTVLATLSRYCIEDEWVGKRFGEAARPLLDAHIHQEEEIWKVLSHYLTPEQIRDLASTLDQYREKFRGKEFVAAVRLPELAEALGQNRVAPTARKSTSIFNLLYLDPLAGLDPATQAVEQTRMLALRAIYYAQRAPILLGWQVELTTYQIASQPESQQVLGDFKGVSSSAQSLARTTELLPGLIHSEREAALNQFFDGVTRERTNLVADLAAQETRLRGLLPEVRQTLEAGGAMASSVQGAIGSLDGFVRSVKAPDTNAPPSSAPSHPFDVREYGQAAERIGAAARELNGALNSLDRTVPGITRLGDQATADAKAVVTHAFLLGLVLLVAAGGITVVTVRLCRRGSP
ncbi:MAG: hypothetical protein U1G08_02100 [Verrucomicrobiota bacterium]